MLKSLGKEDKGQMLPDSTGCNETARKPEESWTLCPGPQPSLWQLCTHGYSFDSILILRAISETFKQTFAFLDFLASFSQDLNPIPARQSIIEECSLITVPASTAWRGTWAKAAPPDEKWRTIFLMSHLLTWTHRTGPGSTYPVAGNSCSLSEEIPLYLCYQPICFIHTSLSLNRPWTAIPCSPFPQLVILQTSAIPFPDRQQPVSLWPCQSQLGFQRQ